MNKKNHTQGEARLGVAWRGEAWQGIFFLAN